MIADREMESLLALSRLRLEPGERQSLSDQLQEIIAYFELLRGYDTSAVDIDLGATVDPDALRADDVQHGLDDPAIGSFAVERNDGYFVVPRILDQE